VLSSQLTTAALESEYIEGTLDNLSEYTGGNEFVEGDFSTQLIIDENAASLGTKKKVGRPPKRKGGKGGPGRGHKKILSILVKRVNSIIN
jgi:hypothetical protein